jgi:dihydropyrimidinase
MDDKTKLLVRGGTVVTDEEMFPADVLVIGEHIAALGHDLAAPDDAEILDAGGQLVLPGIIDAHTHIRLDTGIYRTADNWFEGSRAATFGGITTVVDFATQFEGQSFQEALTVRLKEASSSVIDYAFHMMVTDVPAGREDELGQLPDLGIQSIKLYTTYRPNYYADDAMLLRLLEAGARYGLTTLVHCENDALVSAQIEALVSREQIEWRYHGASRPALAEEEAAARVLFFAKKTGAPVVIAHNSTGEVAARVAAARDEGYIAFSETTPQYLLLNNTAYTTSEAWRYILQPPLRDPIENEKLWDLVSRGRVDMLVTDHCDYKKAQKLAANDFTKTPGGLPGTETLLPLMATYGVAEGRLTWPELVRMLVVNPARIYNLWPRKGVLRPGADADLVIFDPGVDGIITAEDLHMVAGYTPFEGMHTRGQVVNTIRRGEFLVRQGEFVGSLGSGMFVKRAPRFWD